MPAPYVPSSLATATRGRVLGSILLSLAGLGLGCATTARSSVVDASVDEHHASRAVVEADAIHDREAPAHDGASYASPAPPPPPGDVTDMDASPEEPAQRTEESYAMHGEPVAAQDVHSAGPWHRFNTEEYNVVVDRDFVAVHDDARSTFAIDVDTASYSNVRRFLVEGTLPPPDAVRIEELINYFEYDYAPPSGNRPFTVTTEVGACPWAPDHRLVHIGVRGRDVSPGLVPPRNLVFLLDVSGSMDAPDRLPLLKQALSMLVDQLRPEDRVSIVVYAGAAGVVLPPTSGVARTTILSALDHLAAGGSTHGGEGILAAYAMARQGFVRGGINRVILATDGDFNVGATSQGELIRMVERERESGVELSVLGFGRGNLNDAMVEQIADHGNGNYAYIDTADEARKVLVEQVAATLVTIAKDVKIQVEFNPAEVSQFRLIGYENRALTHAEFNDDRKDAGDIGAGHTVTALYEIVPATGRSLGKTDPLRYQRVRRRHAASRRGEMMTVKLRYKAPEGLRSHMLEFPIRPPRDPYAATSDDFRFAAAVAEFGMLLRDSPHRGMASYHHVRSLAMSALHSDWHGRRREFLDLVERAQRLSSPSSPPPHRDSVNEGMERKH